MFELCWLTSWLFMITGGIIVTFIVAIDILNFILQFCIEFEKTRKLKYPRSADVTESN